MKFSIAHPTNGTTKSFDIDDDNKCRVFFQKRMGQQVEADTLGDEFKGYIFKITGGFDKDGFAMKQGVFSNTRVRLLLSPGSKGYRAIRSGEKKRRSVRGCIVGPDIKMLSCTLSKQGEKQIPGLTDEIKPRRLGPKRASGIRKLYGIEKTEGEKSSNTVALIKKHAIRRTFKSKKNENAPQRHKAPKIQRLVTDIRIRRKKIQKDQKVKRWKKSLAATEEYKKLYGAWIEKKKAILSEKKAERKDSVGGKKVEKKVEKVEKKVENKVENKEKRVIVESNSKDGITGAHVKAAITKTKMVIKKK